MLRVTMAAARVTSRTHARLAVAGRRECWPFLLGCNDDSWGVLIRTRLRLQELLQNLETDRDPANRVVVLSEPKSEAETLDCSIVARY